MPASISETGNLPPPSVERGQSFSPATLLMLLACLLIPGLLAYSLATENPIKVTLWVVEVALLLIAFARPFWGMLLFIGLIFVRPEEMSPDLAGMHLTLLVSLVTLVSTWFQFFLDRERVTRSPQITMMFGFAAIVVINAFLTGGLITQTTQDMVRLTLLVLLVLNLVRTPERYRAYVNTLILFTGYVAVYSIILYLSGVGVIEQADTGSVGGLIARSKATGIFGDPNDLAVTIIAGMALALAMVTQVRGLARIPHLLVLGLGSWAVLQTNSRSGMVSFLVVLVTGFICLSRRKAAAIGLIVVVVGTLLAVSSSRMTNFNTQEQSANERLMFWSNGLDQLRQHPLTGCGYTKFPDYNGHRAAHNSFVLCFAELGLPGYFCFIGLIYYAFRRRPKSAPWTPPDERSARDLLASRLALIGYLTGSFFLTRTYIPITFLYITLPVAAQIALSGQTEPYRLTARERLQDFGWIAAICVGSIVFVRLIVYRYGGM
ncbi:MAG TPA: O-antigen ligase family protein [Chthonomonadaceae bacterium]|nr:O-antigen ligase family protein [Chthonomonadaceae bacterium]